MTSSEQHAHEVGVWANQKERKGFIFLDVEKNDF